MKRAKRLWKIRLRTSDELENCLEEIDSLVIAFEGCENDLKDLHVMRHSLRVYRDAYKRLVDDRLRWEEFERLAGDLVQNASDPISENGVPWPPAEVIDAFADCILKSRRQASTQWIVAIEEASDDVASMSATEANQLFERANMPPAVLTEPHEKRLQKVRNKIEKRLDTLKVE